jgi:hypothetical protein
MASSTTKTSVVLKESADWDEWILIVNAMARRGGVTEYVNFTATTEPAEPVRPAIPTFSTVKPGAASLAALDETQQKELLMLREDFKEISRTYREKRDALKDMEQHIMTTVDRQNILYLDGADTVYQKLMALKKRLVPTDRARTLEVTRRYRELLRGPRAQQQEKWLQQYERTYAEAVKIKLPDVQDDRLLYDFLDALRSTDMAYVSGREAVLADRIERNDAPPSVKDLLENYRNYLRMARARMSASKGFSHTAFATLQGAPPENPENEQEQHQEKQNLKKFLDCVCGESYRFKDCVYLIKELRGAEWALNEEIKRQIDDKLSRIPRLRIAVETAQKQAREKKEKKKEKEIAPTTKKGTSAGAFAVECFFYKLKNCWTLDSGTNIHVYNDHTRFLFQRMATEDDVLIAGKTAYAIEAFGSVEITANAPNGPVTIELLNVALAPGFLTNLVCLRRFTDKGVH